MQPPHPAPPTPYPYAPSDRGENGIGTAAMCLGITACVFSFIPIIGVVAWPLLIIGIVFGVIGLLKARAGQATNQASALVGLILSGVALGICVLWIVGLSVQMARMPLPAP